MTELLGRTAIGKTLDVVYLRDGETKNVKLTTISREELNRLNSAFRNRPEGRAQFGYDGGGERMPIPGTKRRKYLEENVGAASLALTAAEIGELDRALAPDKVAGPRYNPQLMATIDR